MEIDADQKQEKVIFGCMIQFQKAQQINNKNNLIQMSTGESQTSNRRLDHIKLPKLRMTKLFRIRSASKEKNQSNNLINNDKDHQNKKLEPVYYSNDKYKSNLMTKKSNKKSSIRKSQANYNSSDQEIIEVGSCRFNSKINIPNDRESMEKQHQLNMQKLSHIANLFDPKTIMKMGCKNTQNSQEQNIKQHKNKMMKGQLRMNQFIFEGKSVKNRKQKHNEISLINDQYWKKVNQSLILGPCKTLQNQVSKDLREIYETLVTQ